MTDSAAAYGAFTIVLIIATLLMSITSFRGNRAAAQTGQPMARDIISVARRTHVPMSSLVHHLALTAIAWALVGLMILTAFVLNHQSGPSDLSPLFFAGSFVAWPLGATIFSGRAGAHQNLSAAFGADKAAEIERALPDSLVEVGGGLYTTPFCAASLLARAIVASAGHPPSIADHATVAAWMNDPKVLPPLGDSLTPNDALGLIARRFSGPDGPIIKNSSDFPYVTLYILGALKDYVEGSQGPFGTAVFALDTTGKGARPGSMIGEDLGEQNLHSVLDGR
jgi:hypothetical protein